VLDPRSRPARQQPESRRPSQHAPDDRNGRGSRARFDLAQTPASFAGGGAYARWAPALEPRPTRARHPRSARRSQPGEGSGAVASASQDDLSVESHARRQRPWRCSFATDAGATEGPTAGSKSALSDTPAALRARRRRARSSADLERRGGRGSTRSAPVRWRRSGMRRRRGSRATPGQPARARPRAGRANECRASGTRG
jgi:hypothetical protein